MWFISQCAEDAIVVLDEPDVYMHADLQRRLVRLVSPMFEQLIIATHSLEIIEEVPSDCIIPINSAKKKVVPIGDEKSLQLLTKELDNTFNIDLARIFVANKFIIFDSDETSRKILSAFQLVLYPDTLHSIITYPKAYVKRWNGWTDAPWRSS
jgi:predicted ATP-binding protein involved in virulence